MELVNHDAEQAVLGAVLIKNQNIEKLLDEINIECFSDQNNRVIYKSMVDLYLEDKVIDLVTLSSKVKENGAKIDYDYISDISESIINLKGFDSYLKILYDLYLKRELQGQCTEILNKIETKDAIELVYDFQEQMLKKMDVDKHSEVTNVKDKVGEYVNSLGDLEDGSIQTGFKKLNDLIGGFTKGNVVILAGRPGMGKSSIALNLFTDITEQYSRCLFFSLEQPEKEMVLRLVSSLSFVEYSRMKKNNLFDYERKKIMKAVRWLESKDLFIDDTSAISIPQLKAKIRKMLLKNRVDVVFIDYIQLMNIGKGKNRYEGIGEIARELKNIAKEFNVLVVALSQLSRDIEKRGKDSKPLLSDLRESGDIEQVADYVFFIDRDFYDPDSSRCDLILAKNRHGSQGTTKLIFKKDCYRFFNVFKGEDWLDDLKQGME